LALAAKLFDAVPPSAHVILLGDKDQLAAVEAGAVFAELCADPSLTAARVRRLSELTGIAATAIRPATALHRTGLTDCGVGLVENQRFPATSPIGRLATNVNAGDAAAVLADLRSPTGASIEWIDDGERALTKSSLERIDGAISAYIEAMRTGGDVAAMFG